MEWIDRIKRAKKKGKFTLEDGQLANSFYTCAVGELSSSGLRGIYKKYPKTVAIKLNFLGYKFFGQVIDNKTRLAHQTYNKINKFKK